MNSRILAYGCLVLCGLLASAEGFAQGQPPQPGRSSGIDIPFRTPGADSIKIVKVLSTKIYHHEEKDSSEISYWVGNVRIKQENTLIDCDSMIMNPKENYLESFGHVHINDNDSTNIFSDYMKYQVDKRTVHFLKNVKMTDGKGILTTEELQYDLNLKIGTYEHGGKIVNNGSVMTSEHATYYEETKDVYFKNHVVLKDPQYDLSADSLLYNTQTQVSTFITETLILFKDSTHRSVRTRSGYYDLKNRKAEFGRRPIITDGSQRITGDSVQIDDSTGISIAKGHAVYRDTAQGVTLIANHMVSNKLKNNFLATEHPLMILKQEKDSIYITADTLYSGRLIDAQELTRQAAIADSMHKKYVDSLQKESADSLHNAALASRTPQDTLIAVKDTSDHQTVKDRSDSLGHVQPDSARRAALADSLAVIRNDSVAKANADSLVRVSSDSLMKVKMTADSLAAGKGKKGRKALPVRGRPPGLNPQAGIRRPPVANRPPDGDTAVDSRRPPDSTRAVVVEDPDKDRQSYVDTAKAPVTDSTLRYILGYHHVRIFSDSLQAVADSMFYSGRDSVFRLFKEPVAWGNGNYQITGDTMYVYTKNKKANRLYVFENGLAINKVGGNFYNQIKGTTINTYFKGGEVDYMRAKGNAESIYYVKDENQAYTGVNKAHADIIDMIFAPKEDSTGRELRRVVLRNDAEGSMIPFKKVNFDDMRLRGFKWQEARRPKRKEELFEDPVTPAPKTDTTASDSTRRPLPDSTANHAADSLRKVQPANPAMTIQQVGSPGTKGNKPAGPGTPTIPATTPPTTPAIKPATKPATGSATKPVQ